MSSPNPFYLASQPTNCFTSPSPLPFNLTSTAYTSTGPGAIASQPTQGGANDPSPRNALVSLATQGITGAIPGHWTENIIDNDTPSVHIYYQKRMFPWLVERQKHEGFGADDVDTVVEGMMAILPKFYPLQSFASLFPTKQLADLAMVQWGTECGYRLARQLKLRRAEKLLEQANDSLEHAKQGFESLAGGMGSWEENQGKLAEEIETISERQREHQARFMEMLGGL